MEDKSILTKEYFKSIISEIFESEEKEHNIKINSCPVTFVEYFEKAFPRKNFSLKKLNNFLYTSQCLGLNCQNGDIYIFPSNIEKLNPIEFRLFYLAKVCFHESRHTIQLNFDDYSYDKFLSNMEYSIMQSKISDYRLRHDSYSIEIGANLYGTRKAREYFKNKFPDKYEKVKKQIDKLESKYYFDYFTYDAIDTFEKYITIQNDFMKKSTKFISKKIENFDKNTKFVFKFPSKDYPVLGIFLGDNYKFKNIKDIVQNEKFKTLDKRIIYTCFSSKTFLNQLNINELSLEEKELIKEALEYTRSLYKNQMLFIKQKKENKEILLIDYLSYQKELLLKLANIDKYYFALSVNNNLSNDNVITINEPTQYIPEYADTHSGFKK